MTQPELEALCAKWQRILRLQDWDIKIRFARRYEMGRDGTQGSCSWTLETKQAVIRILDPNDYDPALAWPQDLEATVVHELLHLHLAPITPEHGTLEHTALEQAIECIEQALVRLARGEAPDSRPAQAMAVEPSSAQAVETFGGKVVSLEEWRAKRASNPKVRRTA